MWLKNLNRIKRQSGKTTEEISKISNIPIGTLNKLFAGQTQDPKLSTIKAVVKSLGYTLDDVADDEENGQPHLSQSEQTHITKYRSIDDKGKHTVDTVLEMEYIRCTTKEQQAAAAVEEKEHLYLVAAHNDAELTEEELELMQQDIGEL